MESSMLAWLSQKQRTAPEEKGGLVEKVKLSPRGESQGSAGDRSQNQSAIERSEGEAYTDDARVKRPQRNQGGSTDAQHLESIDSKPQ